MGRHATSLPGITEPCRADGTVLPERVSLHRFARPKRHTQTHKSTDQRPDANPDKSRSRTLISLLPSDRPTRSGTARIARSRRAETRSIIPSRNALARAAPPAHRCASTGQAGSS